MFVTDFIHNINKIILTYCATCSCIIAYCNIIFNLLHIIILKLHLISLGRLTESLELKYKNIAKYPVRQFWLSSSSNMSCGHCWKIFYISKIQLAEDAMTNKLKSYWLNTETFIFTDSKSSESQVFFNGSSLPKGPRNPTCLLWIITH